MGLRLSFGVGPLRASIPLTSRRRRRSRSAQRGSQGTGVAYTPDGQHVRFVCGHSHRSQVAMLECLSKRQRQIERGDSLHLVTRVLDTPQSRQRDAERAEQKATRQLERAAQRQAHAEQQGAARQARRDRSAAEREAAQQARSDRKAAPREAGSQRAAERKTRRAGRAPRPPLSWPGWGNIAAAALGLTGIVLAGVAGSNAHSPLVPVAGLLLIAAIGGAAVCVPVAVWRKVQARRRLRECQ
jgi:hypothetical protein